MNILIIVGNFLPDPSSVANCTKPFLSALMQHGHTIKLVTNDWSCKKPCVSEIDGVSIQSMPDRFVYYSNKINNYFNKYKSIYVKKILRKIARTPIELRYNFCSREKNMGGWSIHQSVKQCQALHRKARFDLIITFSQPFTAHLIAYRFKKKVDKDILWIMYEFDPYAFSKTSSNLFLSFLKRRHQEEHVFRSADKICLTPELEQLYKKNIYQKYLNKFESFPYAFLKPFKLEQKNPIKIDTECLLVYAGGFYEKIRNPLYALLMITALDIDFKFLILTSYMEKEFDNIVASNKERIILKEKVSQEVALATMKNANILISVGNTIDMQVPAKIFEYIGMGKPIIHFSKIPNDPANTYLSLYPMVLIINEYENREETHKDMIRDFIQKYKNSQMDYEEVLTFLSGMDEKSVTDKFLSIVDDFK